MHETDDREIFQRADRGFASARLGIIGGGQLARMTALAALPLGCEVTVLEQNPLSPAAQLTPLTVTGDWADAETLRQFAARVIGQQQRFKRRPGGCLHATPLLDGH